MVKLAAMRVYFSSRSHWFVFGVELVARPDDGVGGVRIETFEMIFAGAVFVVIAFDAGNVHVAHDLETFLGLGVVADDIAEADDVRGVLRLDVVQDDLEGVQIPVDVCDDGVFHF
jgi:hypothetical protein